MATKIHIARKTALGLKDGFECMLSHKPNAETRKAIREGRSSKGKTFSSVEAMFENILGKNWRKSL